MSSEEKYQSMIDAMRSANNENKRLHNKIGVLQSKLDICTTTLKYIEQHRWVSNTNEPHKWINEFCEVSRIALEKINKVEGK